MAALQGVDEDAAVGSAVDYDSDADARGQKLPPGVLVVGTAHAFRAPPPPPSCPRQI